MCQNGFTTDMISYKMLYGMYMVEIEEVNDGSWWVLRCLVGSSNEKASKVKKSGINADKRGRLFYLVTMEAELWKRKNHPFRQLNLY
jgi:hypothetical protein